MSCVIWDVDADVHTVMIQECKISMKWLDSCLKYSAVQLVNNWNHLILCLGLLTLSKKPGSLYFLLLKMYKQHSASVLSCTPLWCLVGPGIVVCMTQ